MSDRQSIVPPDSNQPRRNFIFSLASLCVTIPVVADLLGGNGSKIEGPSIVSDDASLSTGQNLITNINQYGITLTIDRASINAVSPGCKEEAIAEIRKWTIHGLDGCSSLDREFNKVFERTYPNERNPFSSHPINRQSLEPLVGQENNCVLLLCNEGYAMSNLPYLQEQEQAEKFGLIHHTQLAPEASMLAYKLLVVHNGFKSITGEVLPFDEIGGKNDVNGYGNTIVRGIAVVQAPYPIPCSPGFFISPKNIGATNYTATGYFPNMSPIFTFKQS